MRARFVVVERGVVVQNSYRVQRPSLTRTKADRTRNAAISRYFPHLVWSPCRKSKHGSRIRVPCLRGPYFGVSFPKSLRQMAARGSRRVAGPSPESRFSIALALLQDRRRRQQKEPRNWRTRRGAIEPKALPVHPWSRRDGTGAAD